MYAGLVFHAYIDASYWTREWFLTIFGKFEEKKIEGRGVSLLFFINVVVNLPPALRLFQCALGGTVACVPYMKF